MRVYPLNVNLKWPMCCKCQKYAEVLEYKRSFWSTGKRLLAALQLSWWRRPETQRQLLSVIHNSPSSTPWTKSVLQSSTGRVLFAGVPPPWLMCVCLGGLQLVLEVYWLLWFVSSSVSVVTNQLDLFSTLLVIKCFIYSPRASAAAQPQSDHTTWHICSLDSVDP